MSPKDIQVGKTYTNRGAGRTQRTVLAIGGEHRPEIWLSPEPPPQEPGVLYQQSNQRTPNRLYLSSFASWAGKAAVKAAGGKVA